MICRNTINSIQGGLVYGHMGRGGLHREEDESRAAGIQRRRQPGSESDDTATGGLATLIDGGIDCIDYVDKMLTLEGLEIIYRKNKKIRKKKPGTGAGRKEEDCDYAEDSF